MMAKKSKKEADTNLAKADRRDRNAIAKAKKMTKLFIDECERLSDEARRRSDWGAMAFYDQMARKEYANLLKISPPTKPKGTTNKTKVRIEYLRDVKKRYSPTTQEELASIVADKKERKRAIKHWKKSELENGVTVLNFIKNFKELFGVE